MGYRSDVAAVFYVNKVEHLPTLKLWLDENFPMEEMSNYIRWFDRGMVFEEGNTKWYDDYDDVKLFNTAAEKYKDLCCNRQHEDGAPVFCYEFVRVGESYDDIETEHLGDTCEWLIDVSRSITLDI